MNSNYGRSNQPGSRNTTFDFDLGLNSNRSKPLNDQKSNKPSSYTSSYSSTNPTPSWQPNKPSWTHQPSPANLSTNPGMLSGPTSMVGDITGRSWASAAPPASSGTGIGIPNKNPNLFSDLLGGSSLGQGKSNSNVPLKSATPVSSNNKGPYSMGGMASSLPKTSNSDSQQGFGGYGANVSGVRNQNIGVQPVKSSIGGGLSTNKDPFGSLVDFSAKPVGGGMNSGSKKSEKVKPDDGFGNFQNAQKPTANTAFGDFQNAPKPNTNAAFGEFQYSSKSGASAFVDSNSNSFTGSSADSFSNFDDFSGIPKSQAPVQSSSSGGDSFDELFASPSVSVGNATKGAEDQFSGAEDWGNFGGGDDVGGTTELEGLPPPPAGVSGSSAKNKGMESYKQGQYPDAIKWLSWAVILLEKAGDSAGAGATEVLSSRASCFKEVGEYKKAVTDCTKILERDSKNVFVLVQRALLYESMEKYKLGAEDLRTVMKIDPGNRVARSTIHRLTQMAG